jgi:hypothetical protein
MAQLGVDAVLVLPFTREFSKLPPEEFTRTVLVDALHARLVVEGPNFRFGHKASGDVAVLAGLGARQDFKVEVVDLFVSGAAGEGKPFSSTLTRGLVAAGDVAGAMEVLGRPHRVEGVVVRGAQRGRELGYPTANVETLPHTAIPADGVYAGWLTAAGERMPAAISVGTNPTFDGEACTSPWTSSPTCAAWRSSTRWTRCWCAWRTTSSGPANSWTATPASPAEGRPPQTPASLRVLTYGAAPDPFPRPRQPRGGGCCCQPGCGPGSGYPGCCSASCGAGGAYGC